MNLFLLVPDICFFLFLKHYLTMFGATFAMPFVLSVPLCFAHDPVVISNVINTIFFASGLATLLQSTLGVRYVSVGLAKGIFL